MKHFLYFCLIYSVTTYAQHPEKLGRAKERFGRMSTQVKKAVLGTKNS